MFLSSRDDSLRANYRVQVRTVVISAALALGELAPASKEPSSESRQDAREQYSSKVEAFGAFRTRGSSSCVAQNQQRWHTI